MSRALVRAAAVALALLVLALACREEASPDTYFHLAAGRKIVADGGLARTNEYLAFEQQHRWVNHEWLFQLGAWASYSLGGPQLLGLVKAAIVVLAFATLAWGLWPIGAASTLAALLPAIVLAESRFLARPEIVSLLGTCLVLALLERDRRSPQRWHLIALAVAQVIWTNAHGFALLGPAVTVVWLLAQLAGKAVPWFDTSGAQPRRTALALALQTGASFLNPYFHEGSLYPILVLLRTGKDWSTGGLYMQIVELQSPFTAALADVFEVKLLKATLVLTLVLLAISIRVKRARLEHIFAAGLLVGTAWSYLRNVPFAAVGLTLPFAQGVADLGRLIAARFPDQVEKARLAALFAVLIGALFVGRMGLADELHANAQYDARAGLGFSDFLRYDEAVSFLERSPPRGKLFNNFGAGHFLIFARGDREPRPFICGNTDLYPGKFLVEYHEIVQGAKPFEKAFEERGITDALLDHRVEVSRELLRAIASSPRWRLVHVDSHCVIARLVTPETPPAADPVAVARRPGGFPDESREDRFFPVRLLRKLGLLPPRRPVPLERLHMACLLDALGHPEEALELARQAYQLEPGFAPGLYVLTGLERRRDPRRAEELALELARTIPSAPYPHVSAGLAALAAGDAARAARHFERALELDPDFVLARANLLQAYEAQENVVELRRALARGGVPPEIQAFFEGRAAELSGDLPRAEQGYEVALAHRPSLVQARDYLARCLLRRGAFPEARRELEECLKVHPEDGGLHMNLGIARLRTGDRPGGRESLETAARLRARDAAPLILLGRDALEHGEADRARHYGEEARKRDPRSPQVQALLRDARS